MFENSTTLFITS